MNHLVFKRSGEIYLNSTNWSYDNGDEANESPLRKGEKLMAFRGRNSDVIIKFYKGKDFVGS